MAETRYSESRILARKICRLPGEEHAEFKKKVLRLRRHFEQFNLDVSELCQWLMGLRPEGKRKDNTTKEFWEFFLEPEIFLNDEDKDNSDRYRCQIFDSAIGMSDTSSLSQLNLSKKLIKSIESVATLEYSDSVHNLLQRIYSINHAHRQILLKSAAEWIIARYLRGYKNWERQHDEWLKEKQVWEKKHFELSDEIREKFNNVLKSLCINENNPRICTWERLKESKDNCKYAGERIGKHNHAQLCKKYNEFRNKLKQKKYFVNNVEEYLKLRKIMSKEKALEQLIQNDKKRKWFPKAWEEYLKELNIKEETVIKHGYSLTHCIKFDKECEYNKHTENCVKYKNLLDKQPELQEFDERYREWRKLYFRSPKKPHFRYPSKSTLPMPKIFGRDFFCVDFKQNILELRLDDMAEGDYLQFGFDSWPKDYKPQPKETEDIASIDIHFVGNRAWSGFRFQVRHKESRFSIAQDVLDELRSRKYPRAAQDQLFLNEAREKLLQSFEGNAEKELQILTVDLGTAGGAAAIFEGKTFKKSFLLKLIKIEELYNKLPGKDKDEKVKKTKEEIAKEKQKGLSKGHISMHLESWRKGSEKIAKFRGDKSESQVLGDHDMRGLFVHIQKMLRDWVRLNVSQIIKTAEKFSIDLIVFESMRGFKLPGYNDLDIDKKRRLAIFSHGRIRHKTVEKAVEKGMRVITVPYKKSSQICSACGKEQMDKSKWSKNKKKNMFFCEYNNCKNKSNSDENAARVLGKVFWGAIKLPVT